MNQDTVFIYENSIGSIRFAFDSDFWITDVTGLSGLDVTLSESQSSGQTGATLTNQSVQPRTATFDGAIFEPLDVNRQKLIDVVAPMENATLYKIEDGETLYLDVYPERTPEITPGEGEQDFQMRLRAPYPYWRSVKTLSSMVAGLIAMFEFPFYTGGEWWISKFSDDFFTTIENKGNVPIYPTIVFAARAELSRPELLHIESGKALLFKNTMLAGERMIVTTLYGQQGVVHIDRYGKVTNGFRYLKTGSDLSMALLPGENTLRADAATNRQGLSVTFQHSEGEKSGV